MKKIIFCLVFVFAFGQGAFAEANLYSIFKGANKVYEKVNQSNPPKCDPNRKFRYLYDDTPYAFIEDPDPVKNKANIDRIQKEASILSTSLGAKYDEYLKQHTSESKIVTRADGRKVDIAGIDVPMDTRYRMIDDIFYSSPEYFRLTSMVDYVKKKQSMVCY